MQSSESSRRPLRGRLSRRIFGALLSTSLFAGLVSLAPVAVANAAETVAPPIAAPPTAEALLSGYELGAGLDETMFGRLELLGTQWVDGDVLKVTGTFHENTVFGVRSDWSVYLPPAAEFDGRFYQRLYPFDTGNLADDRTFSRSRGAYQVEYYEYDKIDGAALAADLSRTIAANYYGLDADGVRTAGDDDYVYGYAFGGSGGSPTAVDALEDDTANTWDGVVPFVITAPYTYPTGGDTIPVFRNLLLRGLGDRIWDAMREGGIGRDALYESLSPLQRDVVEELELLGLRWQDIGTVGTTLTADGGPSLPAGYVTDFWTRPGYTGTEDSLIGAFFREVRGTTVDGVVMTDELLAKIAWHRHRAFDPALGLFMYDHLADLAKAGPVETSKRYTGDIKRKGMLIQNMQDAGAIYVSAEWYKRLVASAGHADDFRVYVQSAAGHLDGPLSSGGDVPYLGILEQALTDLATWVEDDAEPAASTGYDFAHNQIALADTAAKRRGLQPVVRVRADGAERVEIAAGESVDLTAVVEPAVAGDVITAIEWNPQTPGAEWTAIDFTPRADGSAAVSLAHAFTAPGTFFPAFRATAYRDGRDGDSIVGRLMDQAAARVVVGAAPVTPAPTPTPTPTAPGTVVTPASGGVTPLTGAQLDAAAPGAVKVPARAAAGETIVVDLGAAAAGRDVEVWLYSAPTRLAAAALSAEGTVTVTIPAATPAGAHRIAVYAADGALLGWAPITVTTAGLAATGASAPWSAAVAAVALLVLGSAALMVRRRVIRTR